eukprot:TRINITY_DN39696_c0_g1_i1.p1 TRINITY_DN39696_c0_g1~~TRINITY_DN39696_c0_g1_i1.p1  ORF type:complete len:120 (+),score=22.38 TRINITY_DN39696_c0_g1_i1:21-380(+)
MGNEQEEYALAEIGASLVVEERVRKIAMEEVAKHNSPEDCWVVLHGKVYDLTKFAKGHVGGRTLITDLAGKDGTLVFGISHGENVLNSIRSSCLLGEVDPASVRPEHRARPPSMLKARL